ncbi:PIN domain-containing protein [Clostridium sp. MCC353]|uniref:PIN domain-containing protein n=1 Tax=Clostridium sp. MCC353 TaxID=2592646 RepID=UPI001C01FBD1|nr:PIN domain-containing protein [Clostridium sp. MCC353]MBT9776878.1 PIN domain-containing protein [Clostridium sp. MCC353]
MRVLVDTNVIIDALIGRPPYFDDADKIIEMCANKKIHGYLAAHSIPNIFYILRKHLSLEARRSAIVNLCNIFTIESIDSEKIIKAIKNENFADFEDCLQDECAVSVQADYIITRNIKDFIQAQVKAVLPHEFLELLR